MACSCDWLPRLPRPTPRRRSPTVPRQEWVLSARGDHRVHQDHFLQQYGLLMDGVRSTEHNQEELQWLLHMVGRGGVPVIKEVASPSGGDRFGWACTFPGRAEPHVLLDLEY